MQYGNVDEQCTYHVGKTQVPMEASIVVRMVVLASDLSLSPTLSDANIGFSEDGLYSRAMRVGLPVPS